MHLLLLLPYKSEGNAFRLTLPFSNDIAAYDGGYEKKVSESAPSYQTFCLLPNLFRADNKFFLSLFFVPWFASAMADSFFRFLQEWCQRFLFFIVGYCLYFLRPSTFA
jgi:hypothetical protein